MWKKVCAFFAVAGASITSALAQVDMTKVNASIDNAQTQGEQVGGLVIGCVAALVVVGVIIALIRKV